MKKPLIVSIVLVVILAAGILWYANSKSAPVSLLNVATSSSNISTSTATTSTPTKPTTKPTTTQAAPPSTEKPLELSFPDNHLDTSDWQTYRNEEFGFEVKYPADWKVGYKKGGDCTGRGDSIAGAFFNPKVAVKNDDRGMSLCIKERPLSAEEEIAKQNGLSIKHVTINGLEGIVEVWNNQSQDMGRYLIEKNTITYDFYYNATGYVEIVQQIILSFKGSE